MSDEVKLYISAGCGPCQKVKEMVEAGKFNREKVDVIDVSTDEGYPAIEKLNIAKVPAAYKGTEQCNLSLDEDILIIECPGDEAPEE